MNKRIAVLIFIFFFSFLLRLWHLNDMGRTWDEVAYVEQGQKFIDLVKQGDFTSSYWYSNFDHPPLARYFYGVASYFDIEGYQKDGKPIFHYDYTHARLVASFFSSLTVLLVTIMGIRYVSFFAGISSGIILAMLPLSVAYGQIATLESFILFFFTASTYAFIRFLEKKSVKNILLTGVLLGLSLEVKQSNILLVPLFILMYLVWYFYHKRKVHGKRIFEKKLLYIFSIGFITFIALWPMPWFHLPEVIRFHNHMWLTQNPLPPPEVFFGKMILVPKIYYVVFFFITTPLAILLLFLAGLKYISDGKKWILYSVLIWFIVPFLQSFYHFRQHGIRYIIEIYAPLAIIAAVGLDFVLRKINIREQKKPFLLLPLIFYMFFVLQQIAPYYLDYFNVLVGGTKGVYEKKYFLLGWWHEGIKEATMYVDTHAKPGSTVGVLHYEVGSVPPLPKHNIKLYEDTYSYDFVIVSYFSVLREGFDDTKVRKNYKHVYSVMAGGAPIVDVYSKK